MSDDWDTVTKIGSRVAAAGGSASGPKETVIKGKSALNAAIRSGAAITTEKKYSSANATDKGTEGQRLTKVDRSDDVVATPKNDNTVLEAIKKRRTEEGYKMTQAQLAQKCAVGANDIKNLESGSAAKNQQLLNKVCRVLKISSKTGEPLADKFAKK